MNDAMKRVEHAKEAVRRATEDEERTRAEVEKYKKAVDSTERVSAPKESWGGWTSYEEMRDQAYKDMWYHMENAPIIPKKQREFAPLRSMCFDDYIGQKRHIERLLAAINTALVKDRPMKHLAIISEAGMGKTSLAACCADALGRTALCTVGSALHTMDDVADLVDQVNGGIAFIDEAHDLAKADLPIISGLLPLLEDYILHTASGSREVEPFTCVMATTSFGMLDRALRSRLGIPYSLDTYSEDEMAKIVVYHAQKQDILLDWTPALSIAYRSRGNPRYALNLLGECVNFAVSAERDAPNVADCNRAFEALCIDKNGLAGEDRNLLELLASGPCSLSKCASALGMDKRTFEETVESFMFRAGYITTNSRGRMLTKKGIEILEEDK